MSEVKQCTKCKEVKALNEFHKHKNSPGGLHNHCKTCKLKYSNKYYQDNSEYFKAHAKKHRAENPEKCKENLKIWKEKNKEHVKQYGKQYRESNLEYYKNKKAEYYKNNCNKEKEYAKNWVKNNLDKANAASARRRARKIRATPPWLNKEQQAEINKYYKQAKQLEKASGVKYHVDHIVPLKGKNVCGLHVPWNLQILTATENIKKRNKL